MCGMYVLYINGQTRERKERRARDYGVEFHENINRRIYMLYEHQCCCVCLWSTARLLPRTTIRPVHWRHILNTVCRGDDETRRARVNNKTRAYSIERAESAFKCINSINI